MPNTKDLTALHWLAPSMVRDGLLKAGDWVMPAAAESASLFGDEQLQLPARFLAVLDRYALDYIKQAPVLVVAAAHGKQLLRREDRLEVGRRFLAACTDGLKLSALMQSYGLAPQLRALSGMAVRHDQLELLKRLSTMVPASALAQTIPKQPGEQQAWLIGLERWRHHMGRHFNNRDLFLDWAAIHVRDAASRMTANDIADFAGRNRTTFNTDWTFAQALAASQRWHVELALRPPLAAASRPDWRAVIDYAPLPTRMDVEGFAFHALQTLEALFEEGARMSHCVRMYAEKVVRGSSRIYSVRQGDQRIATLELVRSARSRADAPRLELAQLKGPHNGRPAPAVWAATSAFIAAVSPPLPATAEAQQARRPPATPIRHVQASHVPRVPSAPRLEDDRVRRLRTDLRQQLGNEVYSSWFNAMEVHPAEGGTLMVTFPTRFLRNWVQSQYADLLLACCGREFPGVQRVDIELRSTGPLRLAGIAQPTTRDVVAAALADSPVDRRLTFPSFAVGTTNRMAHAGAIQIAETIGSGQRSFLNPFYIHGGVGIGKTHLLHAMVQEVRQRMPDARVLYMTAERFRYSLAEALRGPHAEAVQAGLQAIDLLLIDDIEFLNDERTAHEFSRVVDVVSEAGRQVVVAASRTPGQLDQLDGRLRERLARGLLVEIGPLDRQMRLEILNRCVEETRRTSPDFDVDAEILERIADLGLESGRELAGAMARLHATWLCVGLPITHETALYALRDLLPEYEAQRVRIDDILRAVCRHYAVSRSDLLSERRHRTVVKPRQVAMYLARQLTHRSLPEIGRRLGGRSHATVLLAIRRIENERATDALLRAELDDLRRVIGSADPMHRRMRGADDVHPEDGNA